MISMPNFLNISGEGRNVGKTILACNIIAKFSRDYPVIGLKLTPHVHQDVGNAKALITDKDLVLYEETDDYTRKDSSRMLAAGATKAYLIQVTEEKLKTGLEAFFNLAGRNSLVVCESGRLHKIIKPGVSLFLRHLSCQTGDKGKEIADSVHARVVNFSINSFDLNLDSISIENNEWKLTEL